MDAATLSRIQFGLSVGFHFLFPPVTLGLTLFIVIFEFFHLRTAAELYRQASSFLVRILAVVFAFGAGTGIILPLSFGTNWARFSEFAGGFFGLPLTLETLTAFTLESVFLGILVFARQRVSRRVYFISAVCVFLGSHLSAFWIVAANSWMQSPAGVEVAGGSVVLVDFWKALFNPSAGIRFLHVLVASWITGGVLVGGIAAWLLYKGRDAEHAKKLLAFSAVIVLVTTLAQPVVGHQQILQVARNQPVKDAAYEGIFKSTDRAPLYLFGIPDREHHAVYFSVGVSDLLSVLESGDIHARFKGLEEYPESEWPPVNVIFTTFHLMVLIGFFLIGTSVATFVLLRRKTLEKHRGYLLFLVLLIPLPHLANELGWIGTEMGRQPWVIYGLLKTAEADSAALTAPAVLVSLIALAALYLALAFLFFRILTGIIRRGIAPR
jgi:cytochrome d ubiquinol oxidase subunit I